MVNAALRKLSQNPDEFFLLVDSERTDEAAHENATLAQTAEETLALDQAIRCVLSFARNHPNTLVVHETGRLALVEEDGKY